MPVCPAQTARDAEPVEPARPSRPDSDIIALRRPVRPHRFSREGARGVEARERLLFPCRLSVVDCSFAARWIPNWLEPPVNSCFFGRRMGHQPLRIDVAQTPVCRRSFLSDSGAGSLTVAGFRGNDGTGIRYVIPAQAGMTVRTTYHRTHQRHSRASGNDSPHDLSPNAPTSFPRQREPSDVVGNRSA